MHEQRFFIVSMRCVLVRNRLRCSNLTWEVWTEIHATHKHCHWPNSAIVCLARSTSRVSFVQVCDGRKALTWKLESANVVCRGLELPTIRIGRDPRIREGGALEEADSTENKPAINERGDLCETQRRWLRPTLFALVLFLSIHAA